MSIIRHDFGLGARRTIQRFRKLLRLDALHEANIRGNPLPYLERASERIDRLEAVLFDAAAAGKPPPASAARAETITIDRAEYARLTACLTVVQRGIAECGLTECGLNEDDR